MGEVIVELDKETAEMFEEIKKYLGINDDSEALKNTILWFIKERLKL